MTDKQKQLIDVARECTSEFDILSNIQSMYDKTLSDIYHRIESTTDEEVRLAGDCKKLLLELRTLLKERRANKEEIADNQKIYSQAKIIASLTY